ncbi:MAG: hypothetical protein WC343_08770 [Bacilli bacterium]|jgi:hypothetical protein
MSESFAAQFMSPDEKQAMIARDPQSAQALTNAPRVGFAHNCYAGGLGMFFQKTIKNTVLEKLLDTAWQGFLKYRCAGNSTAYRAAKKDPEAVFQYDDPFLALLNRVMKQSIRENHTDNDAARKQQLMRQATDVALTLFNEDVYYRARMKQHLADIIAALAEHPELLDLTPAEAKNITRWNDADQR